MATLRVNEIFFSIQGESSYAGLPCVFVRLTGCNLRCVWCDTEYAFYEGRDMTLEEIQEQVAVHPANLVEITGGEPLLQKDVHELIGRLLDSGRQVLIETGGSLDIRPVDPRATLVYDIKCPDSGMVQKNRWENLAHLRDQDEIKFVIASSRDYDWAREQLMRDELASRRQILFSPVWDKVAPDELAGWILKDGLTVRLQLQVHKVLWGERRGV